MSKYIIKNCPNLSHAIMADGTERNFQCGLEIDKYCQDCTDCVLKQIVKKCRKSLEVSYCPIEQEILELLDIHEVE